MKAPTKPLPIWPIWVFWALIVLYVVIAGSSTSTAPANWFIVCLCISGLVYWSNVHKFGKGYRKAAHR